MSELLDLATLFVGRAKDKELKDDEVLSITEQTLDRLNSFERIENPFGQRPGRRKPKGGDMGRIDMDEVLGDFLIRADELGWPLDEDDVYEIFQDIEARLADYLLEEFLEE